MTRRRSRGPACASVLGTRAMVNVDFSPALLLGMSLVGAGLFLYQLRRIQPEISRDFDVVVSAVATFSGGILIFQVSSAACMCQPKLAAKPCAGAGRADHSCPKRPPCGSWAIMWCTHFSVCRATTCDSRTISSKNKKSAQGAGGCCTLKPCACMRADCQGAVDASMPAATLCRRCVLPLHAQGWRLDPLLLFCQLLVAGGALGFAVETLRLRREVLDVQARPSCPPAL